MSKEKMYNPEDVVPAAITAEPWVKLGTEEDLSNWGCNEQVAYNQMRRQTAKRKFYMEAFDSIYANEITGDYLEFGCHRARTFRMAVSEARRQNMHSMSFRAFDSFAGLPPLHDAEEVAVSDYYAGALTTTEEEFQRLVGTLGYYSDKVKTYKGFYDQSLTPELQAQLVAEGTKASLVCVDCDLYESAVPVFHFIEPFLQPGTLIYIDDYHVGYKGSPFAGVGRAFNELKERSAFRFAPFLTVGGFGMSFITCE
jgi:hypothetical protein